MAAGHADILVCDYNHVFVERVREASLPAMGIELENSILIVDEAHNLPDRIRSGLERRVTDDVFKRALVNIAEYKGNLEKANSNLDLPESGQLRYVRHLEMQVKSLQIPMMNWLKERKKENEMTKGDDMRVPTQDFLDVFSKATEGVLEEDEGDDISRILLMIRRLFSVTIDEEEDSEDEEQNDCTRIAEMLEICIRFRNLSLIHI